MKKWIDWVLTACLVALCPLGGIAQETQPANDRAEIIPVKNMDLRVGLSPADAKYSIGVGDILTVDVWKQPEVSRTLPVRTDGKISLPLINDVQAAGLTPTQLGTQIAEGLRKIIINPQVTVIVNEINSQRIYIVGQVLRGGAYPLAPNLTIVQALSGAGFTPFANLKKIYVVRIENGQKEILPANFKEAVSRQNLKQDLSLKAGDTIVVP